MTIGDGAYIHDLSDPTEQARFVGETIGAYDMEMDDGVVTYRWLRGSNGTFVWLSLDLAEEPFVNIFGVCVAAQAAGFLATDPARDLHDALADPPEKRESGD